MSETKLDKIAESTIGKIVARWVTPAAVGLLIYFAQGIDRSVDELERAQWKLFGEVENLRGVTQEKLDNLTQRVNKSENRLDTHDNWFREIWRKNIAVEPIP